MKIVKPFSINDPGTYTVIDLAKDNTSKEINEESLEMLDEIDRKVLFDSSL